MAMLTEVWKLVFKRPFTNRFPAKYAPKNVHHFLRRVQEGKEKIVPPVPTPPNFRGKIEYDMDKCVGCGLCIKVCPTKAIEFRQCEKAEILHCKEGVKLATPLKIRIYVSRCCFCAQCTEICPKKCLSMSSEFLLANEDKMAKELIVDGLH